MRLVAMDYFRAIAIALIVAGHSYLPWLVSSPGERLLDNLIAGGTSLFVFISGFFFHHTFSDRFNYGKFLKKKAKSVLAPYAILSLSAFLVYVLLSRPLPFGEALQTINPASFLEYVGALIKYLWTGRIVNVYWYIPFIFLVFLGSPLFIIYIKLGLNARLVLFFGLLIFSSIAHRPANNLSPVHSLVYFIPIYLLGINYSLHKHGCDRFIRGKYVYLGIVVLLLAFFQAYVLGLHGNYHKQEIFSFAGVDVVIFQKIFMCFFLLSLLQEIEYKNVPFLRFLAASSFAVFFIHPWILAIIRAQGVYPYFEFLHGSGFMLAMFPVVLSISLAVAYLIKSCLRGMSVYVIGW